MRRRASLLVLFFAVYAASSCASIPRVPAARASIAVVDVHATIAAVDDLERDLFAAGQIDAATHAKLNAPILTLLKAGKAFNESIKAAVLVPEATRQHYQTAVDAVASALRAIGDALPDGPIKAKLLMVVALAQGALAGAATSLMGGAL